MTGARGFVLVNALVLVAALAAMALWLLSRAENGMVRAGATLNSVQLELYLDAYENLARSLLNRDPGAVDHRKEAWARSDHALSLDRGEVSGQITDLQGRFNVNWLANPEDAASREAFDRLILRLGISQQTGNLILASIGPGGSGQGRRAGHDVAENMPGGAVLTLDQLPLSGRAMERLGPYLAALSGDSRLNVNTVSATVLSSFLPGVNPAALDTVLRRRETEPFASVEAFTDEAVRLLGAELVAGLDTDRLSIGSDWFVVSIMARLEGQQAAREAVLHRLPLPDGAQVAYRRDRW